MADPLTIVRAGNGTSTVTYELPKDVWQYVESVLVEIDNTAGGDAQPTLQIKASPSVVIAAKQLGDVIPAGDTGTASWWLRGADSTATGLASLLAHASFTPAEVLAGTSKTLVSGRANTIIVPLDFFLVPSANFDPVWVGFQPQMSLDTVGAVAFNWYAFGIDGLGTTRYVSLIGMIGEAGFNSIQLDLAGESLRAVVYPNGLTSVTTGHVEVFVRYQLYRITL